MLLYDRFLKNISQILFLLFIDDTAYEFVNFYRYDIDVLFLNEEAKIRSLMSQFVKLLCQLVDCQHVYSRKVLQIIKNNYDT